MKEALKTKKITKQFDGVKAVNNLSISLERGKVTSIIGPNGSGKTTLVNILTGMFPFDKGVAVVGGAKIYHIKAFDVPAYGMTRTFQQVRLFEQMNALDNILVVLTERGTFSSLFERHKGLHEERAREILKKVGLYEKKKENAENLSYGQRKLLEIGRAIAMDAETYFFDEPFAGLFPEMRKIVSDTILGLREKGKTVVLIEHDMDIIRELSDHVIVLDAGELLAEGTAKEVLENNKVIEAYLGE